jgi:hypothetical protein
MQRVQIPLIGETLLDRLAVLVASFEFGCDRFMFFSFYD